MDNDEITVASSLEVSCTSEVKEKIAKDLLIDTPPQELAQATLALPEQESKD